MVDNWTTTEAVSLQPPTTVGPASGVTAAIGSVLGTTFEALSGFRRARTFHPKGVVVRTIADIAAANAPGAFPHGRFPALVRLSRAVGLPGSVPDIFGVAIRMIDAGGPLVHQDLLLAATGSGPLGRKVLRPARRFTDSMYTSMFPHESHGRRMVFGASLQGPAGTDLRDVDDLIEVLAHQTLTLDLQWADPSGPWQTLATLALGPTDEAADIPSLAFDAHNCVPGIRPAGWLNSLRPAAYAGSRRGRSLADVPDMENPTGTTGSQPGDAR